MSANKFKELINQKRAVLAKKRLREEVIRPMQKKAYRLSAHPSQLFPEKVAKVKRKVLREFEVKRPEMRAVPVTKTCQAIAEHLVGDSQAVVEERHGLSNGYINKMLSHNFADRNKLDRILENVLLENAVVSGAIFQEKAHELTAPQAAVAAGIFSQRYAEKKRDKQNADSGTAPVAVLIQLNNTLERVRSIRNATPVIETPVTVRRISHASNHSDTESESGGEDDTSDD